jgi:hypothetical protein
MSHLSSIPEGGASLHPPPRTDFSHACMAVVKEEVDVWSAALRPMFAARAEEIVEGRLAQLDLVRPVTEILGRIGTSQYQDADLGESLWTAPGAALGGGPRQSGLWTSAGTELPYAASVGTLVVAVSECAVGILEDVAVYTNAAAPGPSGEPLPLPPSHQTDALAVHKFVAKATRNRLMEVAAELEALVKGELTSTDSEIGIQRACFIARVLRSIPSAPALSSLLAPPSVSVSTKDLLAQYRRRVAGAGSRADRGPQSSKFASLAADLTVIGLALCDGWARWIVGLVEAGLDAFLSSTALGQDGGSEAWHAVAIDGATPGKDRADSVRIPWQPSSAVAALLHEACRAIHRFDGHAPHPAAIRALDTMILNASLSKITTALADTAALSEAGVLQAYFDGLYLVELLRTDLSMGDDDSVASRAGGTWFGIVHAPVKEFLEGISASVALKVDVIDWEIYKPHIAEAARKAAGRTAMLFGALSLAARPWHFKHAGGSRGADGSGASSVAFVAPVPRLKLLPVAMPRASSSSSVRSAGVAIDPSGGSGGSGSGPASAAGDRDSTGSKITSSFVSAGLKLGRGVEAGLDIFRRKRAISPNPE